MRCLPGRLFAAASLVSLLLACAHRVPSEPADDLAGQSLRLRPTGQVRLVLNGRVGPARAEVMLELSQPITLVTEGCFEKLPRSNTTVRYPVPQGGYVEAAQVEVGNARMGGVRLGPRVMALVEGKRCKLVVGSDVLDGYALEVDPGTREVRILPSRPRASYLETATSPEAQASGFEYHLVELSRDPSADWPLLAARATQDGKVLTGAFVLSTAASTSTLDAEAASGIGFRTGPELLRGLELPPSVQLPRALGGDLYGLERLELAPGFGVSRVDSEADGDWKNPAALGILGGDVWGRFHAILDPAAGVLLLRRPRVFTSGTRQRCAQGKGAPNSAEACFVLHQRDLEDGGLDWVITVWRELPRGGRIYLDVVDQAGQSLDRACQVGMSFTRSGRGASAAHRLPWRGLERAAPGCARALREAAEVRFGLWEEGPLSECPGSCAFVQDVLRERVSCECQGGTLGAAGASEHRFLELYRELLEQKRQREEPGE